MTSLRRLLPTRRSVSLAAVAAALSATREAGATEIGLSYDAPPSCPSRAEFVKKMSERSGRITLVAGSGAKVTLRADGKSFVGALQTAPDREVRELRASSCNELASAISLVLALAYDPDAPLEAPRIPRPARDPVGSAPRSNPAPTGPTPTGPTPTGPTPTGPTPTDPTPGAGPDGEPGRSPGTSVPPTAESTPRPSPAQSSVPRRIDPPAREVHRTRGFAGVFGEASTQGPPLWAGRLAVGVTRDGRVFSPTVTLSAARSLPFRKTEGSLSARLRFSDVQLEACPVKSPGKRWFVRGCVFGGFDVIEASPSGTTNLVDRGSLGGFGGVSVPISWFLTRSVALAGALEMWVSFRQLRFFIEPSTTLYELAPVALRGRLGVNVFFP